MGFAFEVVVEGEGFNAKRLASAFALEGIEAVPNATTLGRRPRADALRVAVCAPSTSVNNR
eukprot:1874587-Amphidinium_carterae.1